MAGHLPAARNYPRRIPSPMFLAAVIGVERLLCVDFNATARPVSLVRLALEGVKQKKAQCPPIIK